MSAAEPSRAGRGERRGGEGALGASVGRSLAASPREAGVGCPHCSIEVAVGDPVVVCQACGTVHHQSCWQARGGCGSYHCAPARRPELASNRSEPVLLITAAEIDRAIPMGAGGRPHRAGAVALGPDGRMRGPVPSSPGGRGSNRVKISRLAIASLACAIAGIPLALVGGLVAVLLGILALGAIHSGARRGIGLAVPGLLLGVLDVAGWAYLLSVVPWHAVAPDAMFSDPPPDVADIQELDPPLQRAMRANVLIRRRHGLALLGGKAIGSGVILRVEGGKALIVTNRHVVDPKFPSDHDNSAAQLTRLGRLTVRILGQPDTEGQVIWMAPGQIDLALVRAPCSATSMGQAAPWEKGRAMRVGEPVFAIGNPHDLGWTHTQGVISQFRNRTYDSRRIRVIQTQAAINPGNSGGGLYDQQGYCLGINTWTADKSISEGIGFAIALDTLVDLAPPPLAVPEEKTAEVASPGPTDEEAGRDRAHPLETGDHPR
jgi:Trypsin-like peptidase domain/Prokaryotic RING finger family 1